MEQLISGLVLIQLPLELLHQQNGNALFGEVAFTGYSYLQFDLSLMGQQSEAVFYLRNLDSLKYKACQITSMNYGKRSVEQKPGDIC